MPTVVVGREQSDLFDRDPLNIKYMDYAATIKTLDAAMNFAYRTTGTDKVIIFDGAMAGLNVSTSLAELLIQKAPIVSERVDKELLPKWLRQRGVDPSILDKLLKGD
jgi:hypothetical protein